MDLLHHSAAWLAAQMKEFASREVVYKRGPKAVTVLATMGRTRLAETDDTGSGGETAVQWNVRDFLIDAADLIFAGDAAPLVPDVGDRIEVEELPGKTFTYQVCSPGQGQPEWTWSDLYRIKRRIHGKEIAIT